MVQSAEAAKAAAPPPPKKGPVLIIMAVLAALIVGGAGGIFFMLKRLPPPGPVKPVAATPEGGEASEEGGKGEKEAAEGGEGHEGGDKEGKGAGEAGGSVVTMQPYVVNLVDETGEQRYLKVSLAVELASSHYEKVFERQTPRIRNAVLMYMSNLKTSDILGAQTKQNMVERLRNEVQTILGKRAVHDVYLTEFVVQ